MNEKGIIVALSAVYLSTRRFRNPEPSIYFGKPFRGKNSTREPRTRTRSNNKPSSHFYAERCIRLDGKNTSSSSQGRKLTFECLLKPRNALLKWAITFYEWNEFSRPGGNVVSCVACYDRVKSNFCPFKACCVLKTVLEVVGRSVTPPSRGQYDVCVRNCIRNVDRGRKFYLFWRVNKVSFSVSLSQSALWQYILLIARGRKIFYLSLSRSVRFNSVAAENIIIFFLFLICISLAFVIQFIFSTHRNAVAWK